MTRCSVLRCSEGLDRGLKYRKSCERGVGHLLGGRQVFGLGRLVSVGGGGVVVNGGLSRY